MKVHDWWGKVVFVFLTVFILTLFYVGQIKKPVSKLYVNQELRQEAFLACVKALPANASTSSVRECSSEAEKLATTGDDSGKILYRPKQGDVK